MEFYKSGSGKTSELTLIDSKRILCFGRYYAHHPENMSSYVDELLPVSPSNSIVQKPFGKSGSIIQFLLMNSDKRLAEEHNLSIVHVFEFAPQLVLSHSSPSGKAVLCYVYHNKILIIASIMQDIAFSKIVNFSSSEDILYQLHACIINVFSGEFNIQIILTGEISEDSKITNVLKRYYPEVKVLSASPDQL